jgi:hypothetical protein
VEKAKAAPAHHGSKMAFRETKRLRRMAGGGHHHHRPTASVKTDLASPVDGDGDSESVAAVLGRHSTSQGSGHSNSSTDLKAWKDEQSPSGDSGFDDGGMNDGAGGGGKASSALHQQHQQQQQQQQKQNQAFGGILVSQEITVDVQELPSSRDVPSSRHGPGAGPIGAAADTGRHHHRTANGALSPGGDDGLRSAHSSSSLGGTSIELRSLPSPNRFPGSRVHIGTGANSVSNIEAGRAGDRIPDTFADELFAACVDGR